MIFVRDRFTPRLMSCRNGTGPDYLVYTTFDDHTVVGEIYIRGDEGPYFSTRENFCLSSGFVDKMMSAIVE